MPTTYQPTGGSVTKGSSMIPSSRAVRDESDYSVGTLVIVEDRPGIGIGKIVYIHPDDSLPYLVDFEDELTLWFQLSDLLRVVP